MIECCPKFLGKGTSAKWNSCSCRKTGVDLGACSYSWESQLIGGSLPILVFLCHPRVLTSLAFFPHNPHDSASR
jgi:hypothetical protein